MELKASSKSVSDGSLVEILKCKWTILVITSLAEGLKRPSEVKRAIPGITTKILNERLSKLEQKGVIKRKSFRGYPLRVEYALTLQGKKVRSIIEELRGLRMSINETTEVISCKWMLSILNVLEVRESRTNQIRAEVPGISNKILSERLRKLQQMELVLRNVIDSNPPGVSYSLTAKGRQLINFINPSGIY